MALVCGVSYITVYEGFAISYPIFGQYTPEFANGTNFTGTCENPVYNTTIMKTTIVTEFNLVCSREWINSSLTSVTFIGFLLGASLGGFLSDKYGRKKTFTAFFMACILQSLVLING